MPDPVTPLPVEETPEILPVPDVPPPTPAPSAPPPVAPKKTGSFGRTIGIFAACIIIFVVGVWLSSFVRQFFPSSAPISSQPTTGSSLTPTPTSVPSDPYALWKTYDAVSGTTKAPIGVRFKLPPDVLAPICDGVGCASQGTYLPDGTRFTVAPRGAGQGLRDFRGTIISDVNGIPFTTKQTTVAGLPASEFSGTFTGHTVSGYAFSQMRGVMIALSDTMSIEFNHFTPSGIAADFAKDDALFDQILETIVYAGASGEKGIAPISTSSAKPATSSGY